MRMLHAMLALAVPISGCHVMPGAPVSAHDRARTLIMDRMAPANPARSRLLIYASGMNQVLDHPGDMKTVHDAMVATNCLGIMPAGRLPNEVKSQVDDMLTDTPERAAAYRRYVMDSSSIALTPEEIECAQQ